MWMMVICCALPVAILLFGGTALFSGGYFRWFIFGGLGVAYIWMMFRGHRYRSSDEAHHDMADTKPASQENVSPSDEKKGHSDHSCCH